MSYSDLKVKTKGAQEPADEQPKTNIAQSNPIESIIKELKELMIDYSTKVDSLHTPKTLTEYQKILA